MQVEDDDPERGRTKAMVSSASARRRAASPAATLDRRRGRLPALGAVLAATLLLGACGVSQAAEPTTGGAPTSASGSTRPSASPSAGSPASAARSQTPAPVATPSPTAATSAPASSVAGHQVRAVVGLGDSVPAGDACDCTQYVTLLGQAAQAAEGHPVSVTNLAIGGQTSGQLLQQLDDPATKDAVAAADTVVLTVGANDFDSTIIADPTKVSATNLTAYDGSLASMKANVDQILARIAELRGSQQTAVLVTGYWNVFVDGQVGRGKGGSYLVNSRALTQEVNATLQQVADAHGATYVDLYAPFVNDRGDDTDLLAEDGDHPNAAGHELIAQELMDALGIPN